MAKKINGGINSPSFNNSELLENCGGMPKKQDVEQIQKTNLPPKNPPTGPHGARSVRV